VAPPLIDKAFNPIGMEPNFVSTLTLTISNPSANTVALQGIAFTDSFPANLVVATPNNLTNSCGGTAVAVAGSGTVSLVGGTVAVNGSCTVTVTVTATWTGSYSNTTGPVSSTNGGTGGTASATMFVANPPSISKLFVPNTIASESSTLLSFTIQNPNSNSTLPNKDVTLTGIQFTDALPAGLAVANPNGLSSTCGGTVTATPGSSSITLTGGTLAPDVGLRPKLPNANQPAAGTCFISVSVTPTMAGNLNNTTGPISASESGAGPISNTATLMVTPRLAAHDFNGDGKSDIAWRDSSGDLAVWLMNGAAVSSSPGVGSVPTVWSIVGQRDFDGDGKADLLWRDTNGDTAIWFMNGAQVASSASLGNIPQLERRRNGGLRWRWQG
jgi:FG-GAP-like repeat